MNDYTPHPCDFCEGTVHGMTAQSEPVRVAGKVVILDGPTIGKCDRCGHRYFPIKVLRLAEDLAAHPEKATRVASIPIAS